MLRALAFLIIGLAFGGGIGFVLGSGQSRENAVSGAEQMDHSLHEGEAHEHSEVLSVPAGPDAPSLELNLVPDPETGWNLNVITENFAFAADNAGLAHKDGQGHAHLYVNGEKRARVYGPWFHIDSLPPGEVEVEITLNTNDHRSLAVDGEMVKAMVVVKN
ncbi:MAG: hypothetical protein QNJ20_16145 [Paracoccaceae bacterium]|nr:hypothetical protein [Paracoccaceae bacterium]